LRTLKLQNFKAFENCFFLYQKCKVQDFSACLDLHQKKQTLFASCSQFAFKFLLLAFYPIQSAALSLDFKASNSFSALHTAHRAQSFDIDRPNRSSMLDYTQITIISQYQNKQTRVESQLLQTNQFTQFLLPCGTATAREPEPRQISIITSCAKHHQPQPGKSSPLSLAAPTSIDFQLRLITSRTRHDIVCQPLSYHYGSVCGYITTSLSSF
jgi:hypothetical protein